MTDQITRTAPHQPPSRPGRMAAGHVIAVVVLALVMGLLLNAQDILSTAERQEAGWQRTIGVALMRPIAGFADAVFIDTPRSGLDVALGRGPVATTTTLAPVAAPTTVAPTTTVPTERRVSASDPLRMYIAGDSMVGQFGPMLELRAEDAAPVDAEVRYEFESGLTRPDFIDWPAELSSTLSTFDADVVVLFFGGNDAQDIRIEGVWEPFGTDAWIAEYRSRVGGLMSELDAGGRDVYWMGMPVVSSETFQERVDVLNDVYQSEAELFDNVHYVASAPVFSGPDGGYSEYLPDADGDVVDMRLNDGIHLTTDGGILLAAEVWEQVAAAWDLGS
jgi:hypothetical protein